MFFFRINQLDSALFWFKEAYELKKDYAELNTRIQQIGAILEERALQDSALAADTLELK